MSSMVCQSHPSSSAISLIEAGVTADMLSVAEPDAPLFGDELPDRAYGPPVTVNAFRDRLAAPLRGEAAVVESRAVFDPVGGRRGYSQLATKVPGGPAGRRLSTPARASARPGARTAAAILWPSPSPDAGGAPRTASKPASPGLRGSWWPTPWSPWGAAPAPPGRRRCSSP